MFKKTLLYFLFAFSLFSKDGVALIIDSIQEKQSLFVYLENPTDDDAAEEEDASEDIWHFASAGIDDWMFLPYDLVDQKIPSNSEENLLQVHLERIIPPPDKA